jgi:hypothetical protein
MSGITLFHSTDPSGENWLSWVVKIADALDKVFGGDGVGSGSSRSSSSAPWSEQIPYSLGGGSSSLGGVFGAGSSGGGIFTFERNETLGGAPRSLDFGGWVAWGLRWLGGGFPTTQTSYLGMAGANDMKKSPGVQTQRQAYIAAGCPANFPLTQGHGDAYKESMKGVIAGNANWTQFQVGGYGGDGSQITTANGTSTYKITNVAGWSSFAGQTTWGPRIGMKANVWDNPLGPTGAAHNVTQTFVWKEPTPCR